MGSKQCESSQKVALQRIFDFNNTHAYILAIFDKLGLFRSAIVYARNSDIKLCTFPYMQSSTDAANYNSLPDHDGLFLRRQSPNANSTAIFSRG
mmetsp:Transcript_26762/g.32439  ORF Transcript_26762/g.32439 Transcript_26762/m.32439 type:complete len:94 (-) Transcript_26762:265-546(-)